MSPESTAPLPLPRNKKRDSSLRTSLLVPKNERQLELAWTEAPPHDEELVAELEIPAKALDQAIQEKLTNIADEVPRRAYPLAFDPEGPAGSALALLTQTRDQAAQAVNAYGDGDIDSTVSRIAVIAALMSRAYPHTEFNPALGAAVSFIRRATLSADATEISLTELMALAKATRQLAANPLISLDESVDLITELEDQHWVGAAPHIAALVSALFGGEQVPNQSTTQATEQEKSTL
jgi:hypothetical protein